MLVGTAPVSWGYEPYFDWMVMPSFDQLPPPAHMTPLTRIWLAILRGYLVVAGGLVLWRIVDLAVGAG